MKLATPDADGFFDLDNVTLIADYQLCTVTPINEFALDVAGSKKTVSLVCISPGQWEAHTILRACSESCGVEWFDVDVATAKPLNVDGLDELKIARVVGAIGVRPYLLRKGRYSLSDSDTNKIVRSPSYGRDTRLTVTGNRVIYGDRCYWVHSPTLEIPEAATGGMTWPMLKLFLPLTRRKLPPKTRAALRILMLVRLNNGIRDEITMLWTDAAYLAPPAAPMVFDPEDEEALEAMAF